MFQCAPRAYPSAGLVENLGKRDVDAEVKAVLSGHIDRRRGIVSGPLVNGASFNLYRAQALHNRLATCEILETLIGCWIDVFMFRHPATCLLQQLARNPQPLTCVR